MVVAVATVAVMVSSVKGRFRLPLLLLLVLDILVDRGCVPIFY